MVRHVLQATLPVVDIEVGVSKPGVSVCTTTAPCSFRHVVVQVNVDALLVQLVSNGIKDL